MVREFISYNGPDAFLLHLPTRSSYPGNECFQHGGHAVARNEVNGEKNDYFRIYLAGMVTKLWSEHTEWPLRGREAQVDVDEGRPRSSCWRTWKVNSFKCSSRILLSSCIMVLAYLGHN